MHPGKPVNSEDLVTQIAVIGAGGAGLSAAAAAAEKGADVSVVLIYYGVARDFSDESSITMLKSPSNIGAGFLTSNCWIIRIFNYCASCAPAGRTLVQVMIESEWQHWKDIREDKDAYNAEKEITSKQVLERLNVVWPGIMDQVEMTNVATPYTWWRFTLNRQGAFEGFAIIDKIFTTSVKRTLPGLDNFFMAGMGGARRRGYTDPGIRKTCRHAPVPPGRQSV